MERKGSLAGDARKETVVSSLRLVFILYIPDSESKEGCHPDMTLGTAKPAFSQTHGGGKGRHSKAENFQLENTEKLPPPLASRL